MPDLRARTLKLYEDYINTWAYRQSFYQRRTEPYLTLDLGQYFNELFGELFSAKLRLRATVGCWLTDKQVPPAAESLIRTLGFQGRHGEGRTSRNAPLAQQVRK